MGVFPAHLVEPQRSSLGNERPPSGLRDLTISSQGTAQPAVAGRGGEKFRKGLLDPVRLDGGLESMGEILLPARGKPILEVTATARLRSSKG